MDLMDKIKSYNEFVNEALVFSENSLRRRVGAMDNVDDVHVENGSSYVKIFFKLHGRKRSSIIWAGNSGRMSGETDAGQQMEYKRKFDTIGEDDIIQAVKDWMNHKENWKLQEGYGSLKESAQNTSLDAQYFLRQAETVLEDEFSNDVMTRNLLEQIMDDIERQHPDGDITLLDIYRIFDDLYDVSKKKETFVKKQLAYVWNSIAA